MKLLKYSFFLSVLMPMVTNAAFPVGQWTVNQYVLNTGAAYSTVGICIQASGSSNGSWYMTNPIRGSGYWMIRGDNIYLHGNLGILNESSELLRINSSLLTGHWQEWLNDGSVNKYFTSKWTFSSGTCLDPA